MDSPLWLLLLIAVVLGSVAALVSQLTAARQTIETNTKARTLSKNIEALIQRNGDRREDLRTLKIKLGDYTKMNIERRERQLDDDALKEAISKAEERSGNLTKIILESETLIVENSRKLADLEREGSLNNWWLAVISIVVGGATAAIFGFLGVLGSEADPNSLTDDVPITTYVVVQSLLLGAGWPLVWDRFTRPEKIEAAATAAIGIFESHIQEVETIERKEV